MLRQTKDLFGRNCSYSNAHPFIRWMGGKRFLSKTIADLSPRKIEVYWEPFLGGGAVFFTLSRNIQDAVLSDMNKELITTWKVVKRSVKPLIERLLEHKVRHSLGNGYYYEVRDHLIATDPVEIAARFIYLNRTCYNGVYRVNKAGKFNNPEGSVRNPPICDRDNLMKVSDLLKHAVIVHGDFNDITPDKGDFVYCDPPYDGTFHRYQKEGFMDDDQRRLEAAASSWRKQGVDVLLSNNDTLKIRKLYRHWNLLETSAPRIINADPKGRGKVGELLIY